MSLFGKRLFKQPNRASEARMRAVLYKEHGPATVLELTDHSKPSPTDDQVLIRVAAAGVNPVDTKLRQHSVTKSLRPLPKITGCDVSGEVVEAPEGSGFNKGDEVCALMPVIGQKWGSTAEFVALKAELVMKKPSNLSVVEASTIPLVGCTVVQALAPVMKSWRGNAKGKNALVQGGSGGVGSFAVQYLSHTLGMRVHATCSTRNMEYVQSLGAEKAIDYTKESFEDYLQDVDLVLDPLCFKFQTQTLRSKNLKRGAQYVHIAASSWKKEDSSKDMFGLGIPESSPAYLLKLFSAKVGEALRRLTVGGAYLVGPIFVHPNGEDLKQAVDALQRNEVRPQLERTFDFQHARDAHSHVEEGRTRGKVAIKVS